MVCTACRRDNPQDVQFCVGCGHRIAASPVAAVAPPIHAATASLHSARPTAVAIDDAVSSAGRPFGVVFAAVVTFLSGLGWLLGSGFLMLLAATETAAGSNAYTNGVLGFAHDSSGEALLSPSFVNIAFPLLNLMGFLAITAAIGVWSLTQWGRRLTAGIQVFGAILGIAILSEAGSRLSQQAGLGSFFVFLGLIVIAYSVTIIVFLLRGEADVWFRAR